MLREKKKTIEQKFRKFNVATLKKADLNRKVHKLNKSVDLSQHKQL